MNRSDCGMNYYDSPTIEQVLNEAQLGSQAAKERMASWLMDEVQAKVLSVLQLERASKSQSSMISNVLIKLVRGDTIQRAPNVFYLRGAIGKATREILVDLWRQRQRRAAKGNLVVAANESLFRKFDELDSRLDRLVQLIDDLRQIHPRKATVVELRYFCGMAVDEIARELGISRSTVEADWRLARAWLFKRLDEDE